MNDGWMRGLLAPPPKGQRVIDAAPPPRLGLLGAPDPSREPPGAQGLLDAAALATTLVPGVGDAVGLLADGWRYATDPSSRTWGNAALTAAGALPFVPALGGMAKAVRDVPYPSWYKSSLSGGEDMRDSFEVLEEPTARDIARQIKNGSGTLRAVRDARDGRIYTWDAETAPHEEVIRYLGLGDQVENLGQIYRPEDLARLKAKP